MIVALTNEECPLCDIGRNQSDSKSTPKTQWSAEPAEEFERNMIVREVARCSQLNETMTGQLRCGFKLVWSCESAVLRLSFQTVTNKGMVSHENFNFALCVIGCACFVMCFSDKR